MYVAGIWTSAILKLIKPYYNRQVLWDWEGNLVKKPRGEHKVNVYKSGVIGMIELIEMKWKGWLEWLDDLDALNQLKQPSRFADEGAFRCKHVAILGRHSHDFFLLGHCYDWHCEGSWLVLSGQVVLRGGMRRCRGGMASIGPPVTTYFWARSTGLCALSRGRRVSYNVSQDWFTDWGTCTVLPTAGLYTQGTWNMVWYRDASE